MALFNKIIRQLKMLLSDNSSKFQGLSKYDQILKKNNRGRKTKPKSTHHKHNKNNKIVLTRNF